MGKYDEFALVDEGAMSAGEQNICELLVRLCNEKAESNRLKRILITSKLSTIENEEGNTIHLTPTTLEDLQDKA